MSDIAVLAHLAPVLGSAPSGPTIRRGPGPGRHQMRIPGPRGVMRDGRSRSPAGL